MTRMEVKVEVSAETTPGKSFATAASHGAFGLMSAMTALDSTTNIQTVIPLLCSQSATRICWASAVGHHGARMNFRWGHFIRNENPDAFFFLVMEWAIVIRSLRLSKPRSPDLP